MSDDTQEVPSIRRFVSTTVIGAVGMFSAWCVADYCTVRLMPYPEHVGDFDMPLVIGLPLSQFAFALFRLRKSFTYAASSTLAAFVIAAVLVVFAGIPFHFAIGGWF